MNTYDQIGKFGWVSLLSGSAGMGNGHTYFVDGNSGNAANDASVAQGDSWDAPFATINYAISRCSNNADDVILVAQDHTETISDTSATNTSGTTTDEFCVDKTGITIIGLGSNDRRPKISLTSATDACIDIRSPQCTLYNLWFYNNIAANVAMIDAQAAADGLTIENCRFDMASSATDPILMINLTANCDDVTIRGCKFYAAASNDATFAAVKLEGGTDRLRLVDNVFVGDWNEQVIDADTAASTEVEVTGNLFYNVDAGVSNAIDFHAGTTGFVADNVVYCPAAGTGGGPIVAAACVKSNNKVTYSLVELADEVGGASSGLQNHYYVDSGTGAATNDGKSWGTALATVDNAIGKCTASNGDVIHVAAGHAESLTGATVYIWDMDVKGVSVIGEGTGDSRPTFTHTTDATNGIVNLSEDDCRISNCIFIAGVASLKQFILVNGDDCEVDHCTFRGTGTYQPLSCVSIGVADGDSDNFYLHHNEFQVTTAGTGASAIDVVKDMSGIRIEDNYVRGDFDSACIEIPAGGDACTDLRIVHNVLIQALTGQHCIQISGVLITGLIADNTFVCDTRTAVATPAICQMVNNKWSKYGTGMVGMTDVDPNNAGIHLFVNSTATDAADTVGHGYSWNEPAATIDYAVSLCTANAGDIIHVGPGHEETLSEAVFIDLDVAGITIRGHGQGSTKPLITYDHADGEVIIGANDITIDGLRFRPSVNGVTNGIIFDDGMLNCHIKNCEFGFPETATDEFAKCIITGDASNNITIENCKFMAGAQAAVAAIDLAKDTDHTTIRNCVFTGAYSTCVILGSTTASTYLDIDSNLFMTTGSTDTFNLVAASTGVLRDNRIVMNAASGAAALDVGNCWLFNNYLIADDDVTGAAAAIIDNGLGSITVTAADA